jgi:DNA-binding PadR family transcriptional regulator
MAILGLVIQQPDTVASVGVRLEERFPRAQFARSAAHNTLPSLAKRGLVTMVQAGPEPSLDRYAATNEGVELFREWLHESSAGPPALRDAVHAKLELAKEEDLLALIQAIREEERACAEECAPPHARLIAQQRLYRLQPSGGSNWNEKVRSALMVDEALLWGMRARRLQRLRMELEDPGEELESPLADGEDLSYG